MTRNRFDKELDKLFTELIKMGALCEDAITAAVNALLIGGDDYIKSADDLEEEIDDQEREIQSLCMKLLLQQQPVASDFRMISATLKMISDMERIGDQAADIAEICKVIKFSDSDMKSKLHIKEMADATIRMVTASVDSFVKRDVETAWRVMDADDEVDGLFDKVKSELIGIIAENSESGEFCMDLLMIAKYLERIGDHATNIAEWVEYGIKGSHRKSYNQEA